MKTLHERKMASVHGSTGALDQTFETGSTDTGCPLPAAQAFRLVDVGSTVIKGLIVAEDGTMRNAFSVRRPGENIAAQVEEFLTVIGEAGQTRICSSANGGLKVGLLCLGKRTSGAATKRAIEAVGANIQNVQSWHEPIDSPSRIVDMLIIVGGIDHYSAARVRAGLERLDLSGYRFDRLVYAGHADGRELARRRWPDVTIVDNLLVHGLSPTDGPLPDYVTETYLDDIESKREIVPLQSKSSVNIEPTPSVVSRAFRRLQERFASPMIMIDIGGATTDLHFSVDLVDEDLTAGRLSSFAEVGRHVYTGFGVSESRESTISAFLADAHAVDLLVKLYGDRHREIYGELLEGRAPDYVLHLACAYLSLVRVTVQSSGAPRLQLTRLASLGLTGGASQQVDPGDLRTVLGAVVGHEHHARIFVDQNYRWWGIGLLDECEITEKTWKDCDV